MDSFIWRDRAFLFLGNSHLIGHSGFSILSLRLMVEPIYRPRKPKLSPLYQSIVSHFAEFDSVYEERCHPHPHCVVTDGCFMPDGWFYVLPEIDVKKLESLFRHRVLKLLLKEKKISREWVLTPQKEGSIT